MPKITVIDTPKVLAEASILPSEDFTFEDGKTVLDLYTELYADPLLKPLLDIAAIATNKPQDYPFKHKKNLSITFFDAFTLPNKNKTDFGNYNVTEDKIQITTQHSLEKVKSYLIHEICHMAANHIYQNDAKAYPKKDKATKTAYKSAAESDLPHYYKGPIGKKNTGQITRRDVKSVMTDSYTNKNYIKHKHWKEEQIVRIPQLIAEFGDAQSVAKHSPKLFKYYHEEFLKDCTTFIYKQDENLGLKYGFEENKYSPKAPQEKPTPISIRTLKGKNNAWLPLKGMAINILEQAKIKAHGNSLSGEMSQDKKEQEVKRIFGLLKDCFTQYQHQKIQPTVLDNITVVVANIVKEGFKQHNTLGNLSRFHKPSHRGYDASKVLDKDITDAINEELAKMDKKKTTHQDREKHREKNKPKDKSRE